ncbi:NTP transferase domain-containing protein [Tellurirhabdus rosea]|uniref:NTP transferase domain-containing protein n=1 Tax=Tellurirhabdus rosea TaxID=2674997 RepID=UPI0022518751|nr:NTP transferase domain-containing protein [Tellurirhabdus rosea]
MDKHEKHGKITRPDLGTFARTELALLGTPCGQIKTLAYALISALKDQVTVAYVDADHKGEDTPETIPALHAGAAQVYTDKISFQRFDTVRPLNDFQRRPAFQDYDLVLVNGNHFAAKAQIVVVDPAKSLEKKLDRLTSVRLILLKDTDTLPDSLKNHLGEQLATVPVFRFEETDRVVSFVREFVENARPPVYGLVLAGGQSSRMGTDKGRLDYHGKPQREYALDLLRPLCEKVFLSVNEKQRAELADSPLNLVPDTFLDLGPLGGILSAFRQQPDAAWLVVACDLPLLSEKTLRVLVEKRNPSKMATAFYDSDHRFPEPLISLWEPRAYPTLLQFLAMGFSCPRKALINSDVQLLDAPDVREFANANDPAERERILSRL